MNFLNKANLHRDWLSLAAVLLVAAALRLGDIGVTQYRYDEATLSGLAQDIVSGRAFPTLGLPTTTGVPWSPMSIYVMTIPYLLSDSPVFATAFVAMLNVSGAGLLWWLARRFISPTVALLAGLVYASNPWAVLTSRKIWTPYLISPFLILAVTTGLYAFINGKRWAQVVCLPLFVITAQIHPQGVALLPIYVWLLWLGRNNMFKRGLALSAVLAGLTLIPFLIGLRQIEPEQSAAIESLVSGEGRSLTLNMATLPLLTQYITGLGVETWFTAPRQQADLLREVPPPAVLWFVLGGLTLLGVPAVWVRYRRIALLIILWATLPFLLLTLSLTRLQVHYFIASIPAFSLLAAIGLEWLISHLPQRRSLVAVRWAIFGILGIVLLTQGFWWRGLVRYLDTHATPNGFGTPLHYLMDVRQQLMQFDDVIIVGGGGRTSAWIWQPLLYALDCVREAVIAEGGVVVFPKERFAALYPPDTSNVPLDDRIRNLYQNDEETVYPLRDGENPYTVFSFSAAPQWSGPELETVSPIHFDNGVWLTGYRLEPERMYLRWQLSNGDGAHDYQYFGHFLDQDGERLGQRDTAFWPSRYWCEGDTIITWVNSDLPQATTTLRVGMYVLDRGQIIGSNILNDNGQPTGQYADILLNQNIVRVAGG